MHPQTQVALGRQTNVIRVTSGVRPLAVRQTKESKTIILPGKHFSSHMIFIASLPCSSKRPRESSRDRQQPDNASETEDDDDPDNNPVLIDQ